MRYNLSSVMSEAHRISTITGKSMSESLKKAWMNEKLSKMMQKRICHFYYQKMDGSIREAYGTMQAKHIEGLVQGTGRRNRDCCTYFDMAVREFRCYKSYNIISIN